MTKKLQLELTEAEAFDLYCIIKETKRQGWYMGRKDYWDKHINSIFEKLQKMI